jgi:membrane-associated phospholipid phosphatase
MRTKDWFWVLLLIGAILLTVAVKYLPYFPGDVAVTQLVQFMMLADMNWAQRVSSTAKFPSILILLAVTIVISWWVAGWRAALAAMACFAGMWLVGRWLGLVVARPRPYPDLVRVAEKLSGSSFPSIFALNYASTIGFLAVLFYRKTSGWLRTGVLITCCAFLLIGWTARIALGAHWPSDVMLSYLIGLLWTAFVIRFV